MSSFPLLERAKQHGKRFALRENDDTFSYDDLIQRAGRVATSLLGHEKDLEETRIGVLVPPGADYVAAQWGVWRAGGVFVPLSLSATPKEISYALAAAGQPIEAREAFLAARDLDTMPWRPTSRTEDAIRTAAASRSAPLCDIASIFRDESADGATGWDLLDDHVHLSLSGQARAARAMAATAAPLLGFDAATVAALPDNETYAQRLGRNFYDDYRVSHTLRVLFGIPFMKETNPDAFARFDQAAQAAEVKMSPAILAAAREWQTFRPHAGGLRPLTGMVARVMLRENRPTEALPLYELAANQVPDYTSWHLEYVYFRLACRQKIDGSLDAADLDAASDAIAEGRFLLANGYSESGLTERYVGRLHQLRGEWAEAIPFLLAARPKMQAEDLVATDQALFMSYLRTGRKQEALAIAEEGAKKSGRFRGIYESMRAEAAK